MEKTGLLYLFLASGAVWLLLLAYSLKLRANQRRLEAEIKLVRQLLPKEDENCE